MGSEENQYCTRHQSSPRLTAPDATACKSLEVKPLRTSPKAFVTIFAGGVGEAEGSDTPQAPAAQLIA